MRGSGRGRRGADRGQKREEGAEREWGEGKGSNADNESPCRGCGLIKSSCLRCTATAGSDP